MEGILTRTISDQQRKALAVCAQKICGGFDQLPPYAIIARIMSIEGKSCDDAVKGYQLMRSIGVITDRFVKGGPEIEKAIVKTYFHPVMCDMITRFGLEIESWNLELKGVKPGDASIRLEKASDEELQKFTEDYKRHNGVSYSDDTKELIDAREAIKTMALSLDDDETSQTTIDEQTGYGKNDHNEKDHATKEEIAQFRKSVTSKLAEQDSTNVKRKITETILGLDSDF